MDFVCHGQKPFSKQLQRFIVTGAHDIRAHTEALRIVYMVQEILDGEDRKG